MSRSKAGWARVVPVGRAAAPRPELHETCAMPREQLLARARRLAWRAGADAAAPAPRIVAQTPASAAPRRGPRRPRTARGARASAAAWALARRGLEVFDAFTPTLSRHPFARRMLAVLPPPGRRSLAASVAAAVVLALVGLCGPAGDDGLDAPRVEARALAAPELAAPAVTDTPAPSQPAGIAEAADALADAPRVDPTLERRAADAVAEGRPADAARLHAELAERHPERPVHRAAARILAERAHALAAADSASVDWAGRDSDVR